MTIKRRKRILIIKTGFSEFLDRGVSTVVSLGDVLFCTMLLHLYKEDDVTWVTSAAAKNLLDGNPYIRRLVIFGGNALKEIMRERYDVFINLEKDIGICAFLKDIGAREKYGFYFNDSIHDISTYKDATRLLLLGQENHRHINSNSAEILYGVVGAKWNGQSVILPSKRKKKETYDVGFNYSVGTKWPTKAWPMKHWRELEKRLKSDFVVSWQKGHKNITQYVSWIDSCRVIVSPDSLGQIVAQALGKEVVNLFGPTNYKRMERIPGYHVLASPLKCPYRPCYLPICRYTKFCMEYIKPKDVELEIRRILTK
jgi:heptosyltransferase-2